MSFSEPEVPEPQLVHEQRQIDAVIPGGFDPASRRGIGQKGVPRGQIHPDLPASPKARGRHPIVPARDS
jgi:hypothetical protein